MMMLSEITAMRLLILFGLWVALVNATKSPFSIIIDGGSTGSRLHVFEFVEQPNTSGSTTTSTSSSVECVRRGSARANGALSGFARLDSETHLPVDKASVADHLMDAFQHAADIVPTEYHNTTRVWYAATAGMRLLPESEQSAIYDAVYEGLLDRPDFVFRGILRRDIGTLSGELEGFYGAVAANYLKGTINVDLELNRMGSGDSHSINNKSAKHGPIGALDMGGASTQIVFLPQKVFSHKQDEATCQLEGVCTEGKPTDRMVGDDFFSTSYLSYGADQFRYRLWDKLLIDHEQQLENEEGDACTSEIIENPCSFKGYIQEYEGYTLVGTGDTAKCISQVHRLIPHPTEEVVDNLGTHVGGVEHPPVQGKFFAMSLYFFTLDSLRELSTNDKEAYEALNLSWPNPSIQELYNALDGLCSRAWEGDLEEIQHKAHAFTRAEVLPHRCIESVYMVSLLKDGFGFSPESRDITFTFLVDGSEVEWSLGMALSLRLEENQGAEEDESLDEMNEKRNTTERRTSQNMEDKSKFWETQESYTLIDKSISAQS